MVRVLKWEPSSNYGPHCFIVSNDGLVFIKPTDVITLALFLVDIFKAAFPLVGETVIRIDVLQIDLTMELVVDQIKLNGTL